jgi:hypothetical protein
MTAALSFVSGAAQAAEPAAKHPQWASGDESPRQLELQPSVRAAQYTISSDDWKRSGTNVSADLRFRKPKIPGTSQGTIQAGIEKAMPSLTGKPSDAEQHATHCSATKCLVETCGTSVEYPTFQESLPPGQPAITIISDVPTDRERAEAAVARLKELIEQPVAEPAPIIVSHGQPSEMQPVDDTSTTSTGAVRWTVDRLRLVAQKLAGGARPPLPRDSRGRPAGW